MIQLGDKLKSIQIVTISDKRGKLTVIESQKNKIPFTPQRIFFISEVPVGESRANHAVDCDLLIYPVMGQAMLTVHTWETSNIYPITPAKALLIPPLTYIELSQFSADCILFVAASKTYEDTKYFDLEDLQG